MQNNKPPEKKVIYIHNENENSNDPIISVPFTGELTFRPFADNYLGWDGDDDDWACQMKKAEKSELPNKTGNKDLIDKNNKKLVQERYKKIKPIETKSQRERYSSWFVRFLESILPKSWFLWLERKIGFKKETVYLDSLPPKKRDRYIINERSDFNEYPKMGYGNNRKEGNAREYE